jgi:hypothetical protein
MPTILKKILGRQANKHDFSLLDKGLAQEVVGNKIHLKSNELHKQAKVVCNESPSVSVKKKKSGHIICGGRAG